MKKRGIIFILGVLSILLSVGCSKNENKNNKLDDDIFNKKAKVAQVKMDCKNMNEDLLILLDNYDLFVNRSFGVNFFEFNMISKEKITDKDISITMDTPYPYNITFEEDVNNEEEKINNIRLQTYQMYNDMDWEKLYKLSKSSNYEEYDKYKELYQNDYLLSNTKCDFYYYRVHVNIDISSLKEKTTIDKMTFKYKGKEYVKKINLVLYDIFPGLENDSSVDDAVSVSNIICAELGLIPNKKGLFSINESKFTAQKDIKITDIKVLSNGNTKLKKASINYLGDKAFQQMWKGPVEISKGTKFEVDLTVQDNNFKNQMVYATKVIPIIEYECDGKKGTKYYEAYYRTMPMADEAYACYVDKVDVMSFYNDYYNKVN